MADPPSAVPNHACNRASGPVRTCIGCRERALATELLRVFAVSGTSSTAGSAATATAEVLVLPDPRRRGAGRGAWLHRDQHCIQLAQRRRAFGRALKVPEPVDVSAVSSYVESEKEQ